MTAQSSTTLKPHAPLCGACRHENVPNARYCAGCGHALFEPCGQCAGSVTLTQKFCGSCGFDLGQLLQRRRTEQKQRLSRAVELAKDHHYDDSISLLERVSSTSDYRFGDLSRGAGETLEKVTRLKEQTLTMSQQMIQRAEEAMKQNDRRTAVACLQKVPDRLLDSQSKQILAESRSRLQRLATLKSELQEALRKKDWSGAGSLLDQLLDEDPSHPKYQKLADQTAEKLVSSAERHFAHRAYRESLDCFDAIPSAARRGQHLAARQKVETVQWLAAQFQGEPFASPTLGRLASRYAKEAPGDENAAKLVKELSAQVKKQPENPRSAAAARRGGASGWLGGDVGLFAAPQSIDGADDQQLRQLPSRFCIAMGLALQGLRLGRIEEQFAPKKNPLLSSLSRWQKNSCWGIDVGSSAIRAVLLRKEKQDAKPVVVRSYAAEFDTPTCRHGNEANASQTIRSAIETMLAAVDLGDAPVFVNLPTRELITRFLHLPPVKDKQIELLLANEAKHQLPVAVEELELVRWVAKLDENTQGSRPGFVSAAKKSAVAQRIQLFADAGLKITGLQADPLALVNFVDYEFSDRLDADRRSGTQPEAASPIAMLDAGASKTSLVIVSAEACWFWSVESGSEDLTSLLARSTHTVASEAEKLKRNPAKLQRPADAFAPLETKQEELRSRLVKIAEEAQRKNDWLEVVECWCVGGGPLTHGWIRRVALSH